MIFILAKFDTYFTKQGKKNQSKAEMMALSKFLEPTEILWCGLLHTIRRGVECFQEVATDV